MIKASQKDEQFEQNVKHAEKRGLPLSQLEQEKQVNHIFNEIWRIEQAFVQNTITIASIFQLLHKSYPNEPIFEKYDQVLKNALPQIIQNTALEKQNRMEQLTILYCADNYYQFFIHLTLLHREFDLWGGEYAYENWMQKSQQFSADLIKEAHGRYSPVIFIQHINQLSLIMQELARHTSDINLQSLAGAIKGKIEDVHEKMRKRDAKEEIANLLNQKNDENIELYQKKAVQLFIENRLYLDSEDQMAHQDIKHYYSLFFQEILLNLFKKIEEVKMKIKRRSSSNLEEFHSELRQRLLTYLDYSNKEGFLVVLEPWIQLANLVLADSTLSIAVLKSCIEQQPDSKKLPLMKCFADYLLFIKEHGDEKMVQHSQDAMELMLQR